MDACPSLSLSLSLSLSPFLRLDAAMRACYTRNVTLFKGVSTAGESWGDGGGRKRRAGKFTQEYSFGEYRCREVRGEREREIETNRRRVLEISPRGRRNVRSLQH